MNCEIWKPSFSDRGEKQTNKIKNQDADEKTEAAVQNCNQDIMMFHPFQQEQGKY